MAIKRLASGKVRGTNVALATANSELVAVYTVPANKKAIIKEIVSKARVNPATSSVALYILKTGGTDIPTANSTAIMSLDSDGIGDAVPIRSAAASETDITRTAMTLTLEAGDAIKVRFANGSGGNLNLTTADFSLQVEISGDET